MKSKKVIQMIWWMYIFLLFVIVVVKFNGSIEELKNRTIMFSSEGARNYNLIPFGSIKTQLAHINEWWALKNILGNIIPFVPFGFLLPIVYYKIDSFFKLVVSSIVFILLIEIFQLLTKLGSFDVDDIILNLIGIVCGYVMFLFARAMIEMLKIKRGPNRK